MTKRWFAEDLSEDEIIKLGLYRPGELFASSYLVYRDLLKAKIKEKNSVLQKFMISFPDNQRLNNTKNGIFVGDSALVKYGEDTEMNHFTSDVVITITSQAKNPFICKLQLDVGFFTVWDVIRNNPDYGTPTIKSSVYVHTIRGMSSGAKIFRDNIRARQCTFTFREFSEHKPIITKDSVDRIWKDDYYVK